MGWKRARLHALGFDHCDENEVPTAMLEAMDVPTAPVCAMNPIKQELLAAQTESIRQAAATQALRQQNEQLSTQIGRLKSELDFSLEKGAAHAWADVKGSPYDDSVGIQLARLAELEAGHPESELRLRCKDAEMQLARRKEHDDRVRCAFRRAKYEMWAATFDIMGYSLSFRGSTRNCVLRPAWAPEDADQEFEFVWDSSRKRYTDIKWTPAVEAVASQYRYWIQERQSFAGFVMAVWLERLERDGPPPTRPHPNMQFSD